MATASKAVSLDRVMEAVEEDDNVGFCMACGSEQFNVEPDARKYTCESCGQDKVYGAEQILLEGFLQ